MSMTCPQSTRLLSDAQDRRLSPAEAAELERHLAICPACAECGRQFRLLSLMIRRWRMSAHAR